MLRGSLTKQVFQDRNLRQSGNPGETLGLQVLQHSAHKVGFAFAQPDDVLDLSLADDRLRDAANVRVAGHGRNVHGDFQGDFAVGVNVGGHIDIYADIQILKLGVNQRIDSDSTDARLKRACCHRNAVAYFQRGLLPIYSADLRILDQLSIAVGKECADCGRADGDLEVGRVEIGK